MSISAGEAAGLRRDLARMAYPHTFTRTPRVVDATPNDWNVDTTTTGTPIPGLPCRYRAQETLRTDTGGRVTVDRPSLALPHNAILAVGDQVSAITTSDGVVLLAGPLQVESIVPSAAFGPTLSLRAYLRAGDSR